MLPIGAQPTATGGTESPVCPNGLRARGSAAVVATGGSFSDRANVNRGMLSERPRRGNGESGPLHLSMQPGPGGEMEYTPSLGAGGRKAVRVRIPLAAPQLPPI